MKGKTLFFIPIILLLAISPIRAQTINLSIAASMTDAMKEIMANFSTAHPEADLHPNFASSGSLAKQIEMGAPADIYVSANANWMKYLKEKQLIAPDTDRVFAFNTLVFISEKKYPALSMSDLITFKRIAIGSPQSVPAGKYAEQAMQSAGIFSQLQNGKKLILAKDARQALLYADRGEVDGAFVYKTDALLAHYAKITFIVPKESYSNVSYLLGLTISGVGTPLAKEFHDYMNSAKAAAVLKKFAFEPNT